MSNDDLDHDGFGDGLGERLRDHATGQAPATGLAHQSMVRARGMRRRRAVGAAVAAIAVLAAGIGSAGALGAFTPQPQETVPVANTPVESSTAPVDPSSAPTEAPTTSAPATPDSPRTSTSAPSTPPTNGSKPPLPPSTGSEQSTPEVALCDVRNSSVSLQRVQGSAGHVEYAIILANTSDQPCTVFGYPGVSIVAGDDGDQVGAPADQDDAAKPARVTVKPGGTAQASLLLAQAENYGEECEAVEGRGFRIYVPEERAAQFVELDVTGCKNEKILLMQIRPFTAA